MSESKGVVASKNKSEISAVRVFQSGDSLSTKINDFDVKSIQRRALLHNMSDFDITDSFG